MAAAAAENGALALWATRVMASTSPSELCRLLTTVDAVNLVSTGASKDAIARVLMDKRATVEGWWTEPDAEVPVRLRAFMRSVNERSDATQATEYNNHDRSSQEGLRTRLPAEVLQDEAVVAAAAAAGSDSLPPSLPGHIRAQSFRVPATAGSGHVPRQSDVKTVDEVPPEMDTESVFSKPEEPAGSVVYSEAGDLITRSGPLDDVEGGFALPVQPPQPWLQTDLFKHAASMFYMVRGYELRFVGFACTVLCLWGLIVSGIALFHDDYFQAGSSQACTCSVANAYIGLFEQIVTQVVGAVFHMMLLHGTRGAFGSGPTGTDRDNQAVIQEFLQRSIVQVCVQPTRLHLADTITAIAGAFGILLIIPMSSFLSFYIMYGGFFVFGLLFICKTVCDVGPATSSGGVGATLFVDYYKALFHFQAWSAPWDLDWAASPGQFAARFSISSAAVILACTLLVNAYTWVRMLILVKRHQADLAVFPRNT